MPLESCQKYTATLSEILALTPVVQTIADATDVPGVRLEWLNGAWYGDCGFPSVAQHSALLAANAYNSLGLGARATVNGSQATWDGSAWAGGTSGVDQLTVSGPVGVATFGDSTATMVSNATPFLWAQSTAATIPSTLSPTMSRMLGHNSRKYCRYVGDCGIGGTTTTQMLARGASAASTTRKAVADLARIPGLHVVIVRGGSINDCTSFTTATNDATINAVADRNVAIVKSILSMGYRVVDVGIFGYDGFGGSPTPENLAAIRRAIVMINVRIKASLNGYSRKCVFLDTEGVTHSGGAFLPGASDDGTHLSNYGGSLLESAESAAVESLAIGSPSKIAISDYHNLWCNPSAGLPNTVTSTIYGGGPGSGAVQVTANGILDVDFTTTNTPTSEYRLLIPIAPQLTGLLSGAKISYYYRAEVTDVDGNHVNASLGMDLFLYDVANSGFFRYSTGGGNLAKGTAEGISIPFALDRDASSLGTSSRLQLTVTNLPANGTYKIKAYPPLVFLE